MLYFVNRSYFGCMARQWVGRTFSCCPSVNRCGWRRALQFGRHHIIKSVLKWRFGPVWFRWWMSEQIFSCSFQVGLKSTIARNWRDRCQTAMPVFVLSLFTMVFISRKLLSLTANPIGWLVSVVLISVPGRFGAKQTKNHARSLPPAGRFQTFLTIAPWQRAQHEFGVMVRYTLSVQLCICALIPSFIDSIIHA